MTESEFNSRFDLAPRGYCEGRLIFEQCLMCKGYLQIRPSPEHSESCPCGNIGLDIDAGRFWVRNKQDSSHRTVEAIVKRLGNCAQQGIQLDGSS